MAIRSVFVFAKTCYAKFMARFFVDKLSEDELIGETQSRELIMHNLMIIGASYKENFLKALEESRYPYLVQICICGRYVTYTEVPKSEKEEHLMKFFDLKKDYDLALDAATSIQNRWYGSQYFRWFMEEFEKLKEVYEDNYDAAEIVMVESAALLLN